MRVVAEDAGFGLLYPIWQVVIGLCLVGVSVVAAHKLLMRGPSRMGRAIVVMGTAILCIIALSVLLSVA